MHAHQFHKLDDFTNNIAFNNRKQSGSMFGENRWLVADKPVEFEE
jgi:hypothetical protein